MTERLQACGLLLAGAMLSPVLVGAELTPQEERGKHIYLKGETVDGEEITALMGQPATEVPASVIPCGSCHGRDGRGRPEGGLSPSDLTWAALTKPYGVEHPGGRKHPPYTERYLKRAITMGLDPAGNELHIAMPRYRFTLDDLADLVAYLRRLGEDPDPGVSDKAVRLLTLVPREGPQAPLGEALERALAARFDEVNQSGGLYNRRLELEVLAAPDDAEERAVALRDRLEADDVFALVGAFLPGAEDEISEIARELETPIIAPFSLLPRIDFFSPNPWVFYLLPGPEHLARTLVSFAAGADGTVKAATGKARAAVLAGEDFADASRALREKAAELGWPDVLEVETGPDGPLLQPLLDAGVDALFLLAPGDASRRVFERAAELGWYPRVYLPGNLGGREIFEAPAGFAGRIFLAFPTSPSGPNPRGAGRYRELAERYGLPARHRAAQLSALSAAEVLVEALKRCGRELSRAGLVAALEGFVDFETGLLPALTYDPNRRVGARGGYVVQVDLEGKTLLPVSGWIEAR